MYILSKNAFPIKKHSPVMTVVLQLAELLWTIGLCTQMVFGYAFV
jgi:hypothetical protein